MRRPICVVWLCQTAVLSSSQQTYFFHRPNMWNRPQSAPDHFIFGRIWSSYLSPRSRSSAMNVLCTAVKWSGVEWSAVQCSAVVHHIRGSAVLYVKVQVLPLLLPRGVRQEDRPRWLLHQEVPAAARQVPGQVHLRAVDCSSPGTLGCTMHSLLCTLKHKAGMQTTGTLIKSVFIPH